MASLLATLSSTTPIVGSPISVTVAFNGSNVSTGLTYQWQVSHNGGTTWSNATGTGATGATYTPTGADEGGVVQVLVTYANVSAGTWTAEASSPGISGWDATADLVNGKIYVLNSPSTPLYDATYNIQTNTWIVRPTNEPYVLYDAASAVDASGNIYLIGGNPGINIAEVFHPATNSYTLIASDIFPTEFATAAIGSDAKLYVFGGANGAGGFAPSEVYNPQTNSWSAIRAMPVPVYSASAVAYGSKIYVFGGFSSSGVSNAVQIYDVATGGWTTGATMPASEFGGSAGIVDGKIIVAGGYNSQPVNATQIYDPATNTWTTGPNLPLGGGPAATGQLSDGTQLFVVGGAASPYELQRFVPDIEPLTSNQSAAVDGPPNQTTHTVTVIENASTGTQSLDDTDPDGDTLTVTGVTGGAVGSPLTGTYGTLTINANDTFSYTADNLTAISGAPTGSHPVDSFTYQVGDGHGGVSTETLNLSIDRPPELSAGGIVDYLYSDPGVLLGQNETVTDPDGDSISSVKIDIYFLKFQGDGDQLTATTTGTSITAHYDAASEILTLSGIDTAEHYTQVLDSVSFFSTNPDPTNGGADTDRFVSWTAIDAAGASSGAILEDIDIVPCYCGGTLIETAQGPQSVEALNIGDMVMTASGLARPIKWIGRRSYSGRFILGNTDVLPVCIKAGALDDNVPRRDLWISPHHAMYFKEENDGMLVEARHLVNGVSIVQAERVDQVEYFHIELDTHDAIIAEGALSETFLDDDSRGMFHNAHEYAALYPNCTDPAAPYYAPRCDDGYEVETVRHRIAARAGIGRRIKVHRRAART
jgi:N-acetylneuraminic acid mutarotase